MAEDTSQWVPMVYTGLHDGPVVYKGYLNRKYPVKRGDEPLVHPQDVTRLEKVIVKGKKMFARKQVEAAPAPATPPTPPKANSQPATEHPTPETAPMATEKAHELATGAGLNLATVTGTGKDGLITVADVRQAIANLTEHE